jgi:hypothetical protein
MPTSEIVYLAIAEFREFVHVFTFLKTDDSTVSVRYTRDSIKIVIMIAFNRRCETALSRTVPDKPHCHRLCLTNRTVTDCA